MCMWKAIQFMGAADLDMKPSDWADMQDKLNGMQKTIRQLVDLLHVVFKWTERFSAAEPSIWLLRPALHVSCCVACSIQLMLRCSC